MANSRTRPEAGVERHQLAAADVDRRHHALGGHARRVDVADHHRCSWCSGGPLQQRHRLGRVEPHAAEAARRPPCAAPRRSRPASALLGLGHRPVAAAGAAARCTRAPRARMSTMAPVESSAAGAKPAFRSAASTSAIGACDTATVGASSRSRRDARQRRRPGPAASGPRIARTTSPCRPAAARACGRRRRSDMSSPCGTGVFECLVNSECRFAGGAADVERAPDRLLADPVHHRRAGRLDSRPPSASCSARSRSSGPGTTTVRSACTRKWSIGVGQSAAPSRRRRRPRNRRCNRRGQVC